MPHYPFSPMRLSENTDFRQNKAKNTVLADKIVWNNFKHCPRRGEAYGHADYRCVLRQPHNKGIALLTCLVIVAIITISVSKLTATEFLAIRLTQQLIHKEQAKLYLLGAESLSQLVLKEDGRQTKIDSYQENWSNKMPAMPIEGGSIQGQLDDLQNKLNLNNLIIDNKVNPHFSQLLIDLLTQQGKLSNNEASLFVQSLTDWIDSNDKVTLPEGAEDFYYLGLTKPDRCANTQINDLGELKIIKGFNEQAIENIKPYISTLPSGTLLNINTLSQTLMSLLLPELSSSEVESIVNTIKKRPLKDKNKFWSINEISNLLKNNNDIKNRLNPLLTVKTHYFILKTEVKLGQLVINLESILKRDENNSVSVIKRQTKYY